MGLIAITGIMPHTDPSTRRLNESGVRHDGISTMCTMVYEMGGQPIVKPISTQYNTCFKLQTVRLMGSVLHVHFMRSVILASTVTRLDMKN